MPQITTYAEYFTEEANDPYQGEYRDLMDAFRTVGSPPDEGELYQMMGDADHSYPAAFLWVHVGHGDTQQLKVTHGLSRYAGVVGRPTAWDNKIFSYVHDVLDGGAITSVEFPNRAFTEDREMTKLQLWV